MNFCLRLTRLGAALVFGWLLSGALSAVAAQPVGDPSLAKSTAPEDLSQTELLRSYLQLREQLHATQLAVLNSRVESDAVARAQAAALTEKLDAIKVSIETEREHQRIETQRGAAERDRQESEMQRTNRSFLWVAAAFGGVGLLAMLLTPLFQWRAINRVTEGFAARAQLPHAPPASALALANAATPVISDQAVAVSNQRLMSVIDRVEQRIHDLEHTASHPPVAVAPAAPPPSAPPPAPVFRVQPEPMRHSSMSEVVEQDPRITLLLGKGRLLLSSNKARDALSCYDEILRIDVNHAEALVKKGSALERLKRDEEAIWCYDRAIECDGKKTLAYLYKGGVYNRQGRYDDALRCYEQALQTAEEGQ